MTNINEFCVDFQYIEVKRNTIADYLSREGALRIKTTGKTLDNHLELKEKQKIRDYFLKCRIIMVTLELTQLTKQLACMIKLENYKRK